jgi:ribosome recycling factor
MVQEMVAKAKPLMDAAVAHFIQELKSIRAGRASATILDSVMVSYYGVPTALKQVATVTIPDATQILVQPFDITLIPALRTAIQEAELGLNPSDDGRMLRLSVPPMTSDRREEYIKKVGKMAEAARVNVRTIRGDIWEHIQKAQKDALISEDNRDWGRAEIDKVTGEYNKKIEVLTKEKETELHTV